MQAFQPRPIQLPGTNHTPLFEGNSPNWDKLKRIGIIVVLSILAIIIMASASSYIGRQNNVAQNQSVRPLGAVHTGGVQVTTPTASEIIRLPLFIQGTARLEWFSDGIFPVEVRDGNNNILAQTYAIADIADPESKTANFRAVVEGFDVQPATRIGRVILYKQVLKEDPSIADIASIGIDFSALSGVAWKGTKKTESATTAPDTEGSPAGTIGPDGVWTHSKKTQETNTTTKKVETKKQTTGYQKVIGGPFTCANGIDEDKDGLTDADDPSCHSDGYPSNARTYDGDLDEAARAPTERDSEGNLPGEDKKESESAASGATAQPPNYGQSNTTWQGNAKIRVQP